MNPMEDTLALMNLSLRSGDHFHHRWLSLGVGTNERH